MTNQISEHKKTLKGTVWCIEEIAGRQLAGLGTSTGQLGIYEMIVLETMF